MRRKRICRGSFPKGLCLRGVAGPFPPVGILLLEALPGAAPLHICSSPRALNPAFQTPGAREESGGGKIAAFRDEIPPPFRSQRLPTPRTGREAPGSAPLARNLLEEQPQGLDSAAPGALAAPGGLCLQGGSIPHSRGCPRSSRAVRAGQAESSTELLEHRRCRSRARSRHSGAARGHRAERAGKEELSGRTREEQISQAGRGQRSKSS